MMEDRFLLTAREMLLKANFTPVSREEVTPYRFPSALVWELIGSLQLDWALREDYLSTLPVEINWEGLDPTPFRRYKEMQEKETNIERFPPHSDKAENAFIPSNRVWVFRRGIGIDKTKVDPREVKVSEQDSNICSLLGLLHVREDGSLIDYLLHLACG